MVVRGDGTLWVAGYNHYGQLGLGRGAPQNVLSFAVVDDIKNVRGVSCGLYHTGIMQGDGSMWVAGYNGYGQLGLGHTNNVSKFAVVPDINVREVCCGPRHTVAMITKSCPQCGKNGRNTQLSITIIMEFFYTVREGKETAIISVLNMDCLQHIIKIYNRLRDCGGCTNGWLFCLDDDKHD